MWIAVMNFPVFYRVGRSSNLQGLAASMIKLWERCEVAKIAMKRGSRCIDSELVSEELKVGTVFKLYIAFHVV
jgi:hypothetical protein